MALAIATVYRIWCLAITEYGITKTVVLILLLALICVMAGLVVKGVALVALAIATVYRSWCLATKYGITEKVELMLLLVLISFFQNESIIVVVVFLIWRPLPIGERRGQTIVSHSNERRDNIKTK